MATLDLGLEEVRWPPGEPPDAAGDTETWPLPGADLGRNGDPELMMLMLWERTYTEGFLGTKLCSKCIISLNPCDITL